MRLRLVNWVAGLDRLRAVHWIVLRVLPWALVRRFQAPADGLQASFELAISDPAGREPTRFAVTVADGACRVQTGAGDRPGARAMLAANDLIRLAGGAATWPELLSSGRFELTGDPFMALRFASLFRLPVELEPQRARASAPGQTA